VARSPSGTGIWIGDHLLAATRRVAGGRCLGCYLAGYVGGAEQGRPTSLGTSRSGCVGDPGAKRGRLTGPSPVDRGKAGSKHHIIVDQQGVPLAALVSPANTHDSKVFEQTIDAIKPIAGKAGGQRRRPGKLHADKGYDFPRCRHACVVRGICPRIARRGIESKQRLGRYRWVVERTFAWLHAFRRLRIRYERRDDIHLAFLILGCLIITARFLDR